MVYVFLADGFEEIEALCPVDLMRRADISVTTVSISESKTVVGSHNIRVEADTVMSKLRIDELPELILLPGGMPGALNLSKDARLIELIRTSYAAGSKLGAICAAPFILGELGLLEGRSATCYPGFESQLRGAYVSGKRVVTDGGITTAIGMGASVQFGIELIRVLRGAELSEKIADAIHL